MVKVFDRTSNHLMLVPTDLNEVTIVAPKLPGYLKLHVESPAPVRPRQEEIPGWVRLREAFRQATGVELTCAVSALESPVESPGGEWDELAASIGQVVQHLERTRTALWQREAELAAGVPVTIHPDERHHLAVRLESVLKAGARAIDCQAVAMYLLDETSRHLKLRSCWGLPKSRFLDPPRPLRGAVADLEALVGHAVMLEDTLLMSDWSVPEEFRSAICVPVSTPTTLLGTLWMFCERPRTFTQDESSLLEIVSGRLAADLEREMLLHQAMDIRSIRRQLRHAARWQDQRLPRIKPLLHGWEIAGKTIQGDYLGGDFHDWFVLPDGTLGIVVGDAQGRSVEAGLTAAALHSAVKAHANYRHSVQQLVERTNETLWSASAGDQFASLFYAKIQPASGRFECASAGPIEASIVGQQARPLPTVDDSPLGMQPDAVYPLQREQVQPGDSLIVFSAGFKRAFKMGKAKLLWRLVQRHHAAPATELADRIEAFARQHCRERMVEDRTLLVIKRTMA